MGWTVPTASCYVKLHALHHHPRDVFLGLGNEGRVRPRVGVLHLHRPRHRYLRLLPRGPGLLRWVRRVRVRVSVTATHSVTWPKMSRASDPTCQLFSKDSIFQSEERLFAFCREGPCLEAVCLSALSPRRRVSSSDPLQHPCQEAGIPQSGQRLTEAATGRKCQRLAEKVYW